MKDGTTIDGTRERGLHLKRKVRREPGVDNLRASGRYSRGYFIQTAPQKKKKNSLSRHKEIDQRAVGRIDKKGQSGGGR